MKLWPQHDGKDWVLGTFFCYSCTPTLPYTHVSKTENPQLLRNTEKDLEMEVRTLRASR